MTNKNNTMIELPTALRDKLKFIAKEKGISMKELLRGWVSDYLGRPK